MQEKKRGGKKPGRGWSKALKQNPGRLAIGMQYWIRPTTVSHFDILLWLVAYLGGQSAVIVCGSGRGSATLRQQLLASGSDEGDAVLVGACRLFVASCNACDASGAPSSTEFHARGRAAEGSDDEIEKSQHFSCNRTGTNQIWTSIGASLSRLVVFYEDPCGFESFCGVMSELSKAGAIAKEGSRVFHLNSAKGTQALLADLRFRFGCIVAEVPEALAKLSKDLIRALPPKLREGQETSET